MAKCIKCGKPGDKQYFKDQNYVHVLCEKCYQQKIGHYKLDNSTRGDLAIMSVINMFRDSMHDNREK